MRHPMKRQELFKEIDHFWHDLYGSEYALLDIKAEEEELIGEIRNVSERIGRIFYKTSSLLRNLDDDTLINLGFPSQTLSYVRFKSISYESIIARLDLVVLNDEIKLLELNSDTPTFIKETFHVNQYVCNYFRYNNPNKDMEKQLSQAIIEAVQLSLRSIGASLDGKIVFTSHHDHEEDYYTSQYLMEVSGLNAEFIPLHELIIVDEDQFEKGELVLQRGLYTPNYEKVDLLYRQTYPIEHLINDEDPTTTAKVGEILLKLVEEKRVALLNPPSAFLLQSKAVMALIWGLHEQGHVFYTEEEHKWIQRYFLPTYLDNDWFLEQSLSYVKKPSFGREGDTVEIFNDYGQKKLEDKNKTYTDALPIYQKYIELPPYAIETEKGKEMARIMYGCFLLNGKASAIGIRAGGQITDNASYFLPVGYRNKEE